MDTEASSRWTLNKHLQVEQAYIGKLVQIQMAMAIAKISAGLKQFSTLTTLTT